MSQEDAPGAAGQTPSEGTPPADADGAPPGSDGFMLRLPLFEGPLDLLLHLIERQELDITALSLLAVTEQYLAHLRSADQINLSALADFVAMGARLLLLKSRALLPREETAAEGGEQDGEATDLVAALREYQRYKRAAEHLRRLEEEHRTGYRREAAPPPVPQPTGLDRVTLDALMALFREVLERVPPAEEQPQVQREPVQLADRIRALVAELEQHERLPFRRLIERAQSRIEVIVDFLAVLELLKARFLAAQQSDLFGEIELVRIAGTLSPDAASLASDFDGG